MTSTFQKRKLRLMSTDQRDVYLFLEIGEGREKERKRKINWLFLEVSHVGTRPCNPGMCPD